MRFRQHLLRFLIDRIFGQFSFDKFERAKMIENWNDRSEGMPEALGYSRTLIAIEGG